MERKLKHSAKRIASVAVFLLSLSSLLISLKLFYNMCIFVDEYNTTPATVCGGSFWLYMDWLRLALLFVLCITSFIGIVRPTKKESRSS